MRTFIYIVLLACCCPSWGQEPAAVDSLPVVKELFKQGLALQRQGAIEPSNEQYRMGLAIADRHHYDTIGAKLRINLSINLRNQGRYMEADNLMWQMVLQGISRSDMRMMANGYSNLAVGYVRRGDFARAMDYYLIVMSIDERTGNEQELYATLNNMAGIQSSQNDLPAALRTIERALELATAMGDTLRMATCLVNTGNIYTAGGRYDKALGYLLRGLDGVPQRGVPLRINALMNIGSIYTKRQAFDSAQYYLGRALELAQQLGISRPMSEVLMKQALLDMAQGKMGPARQAALNAIEAATPTQHLEVVRDSHELLASLAAKSGNFAEAYRHQVEFKALSDSIFNETNIREIAALESKYAYEKERQQYKRERAEHETKIRAQLQTILSLAAITLLVVVLSVVLYRSYRFKKRLLRVEIDTQNRQLEENQRQIASATLKLLQNAESDAHCIKTLEQVEQYITPDGEQELRSLLTYYKHKSGYAHWEEFETLFLKVHPSFHATLSDQFPDLSPNERKLCIFIKLNMSNKDIAQITFQSEEALKKARLRLRKKLGLERETNLNAFINGL